MPDPAGTGQPIHSSQLQSASIVVRWARYLLRRLDAPQQRERTAATRALTREIAEIRAAHDQLAGEVASIHAWLRATSDRGDELAGRAQWLTDETAARARDFAAVLSELHRLDRLVASDVALMGEADGMEPFTTPEGHRVVGFRDGTDPSPDSDLYLGFENIFRGSESEIRRRQSAYLGLLRDHSPVLDVGCGRGELLDLLNEAGVSARGVDLDPGMVDRCRDKGLAVEQLDGIAALRSCPPRSLGGVVAAQVIEHLPYDQLLTFAQAAHAALAPAGVLILETVNPHAAQARKHFWIDPTHQHPLFPEVVLSLLRMVGFVTAYIWHPQGTDDPDRDRAEQLDYVVVATVAI